MMNKIDYLITGGCSFSQLHTFDVAWPVHLEKRLSPSIAVHTGKGAAGNGVISRLVILEVIKALQKGIDPEKIMVAVMWSGVNRHEVYSTRNDFPHTPIDGPEDYYHNPLRLNSSEKNIYIMNIGWEDYSSKLYYENFYDELGSIVLTLEHVLRVQWFLASAGIKYTMTEYSYDCLSKCFPVNYQESFHQPNTFREHLDVDILWSMVDWARWLPVKSMSHWVDSNCIPYARPNNDHPSTEAHERFTQEVIVPHLQKQGYIA